MTWCAADRESPSQQAMDGHELWREIVRATDGLGSHATSMRIPLFILLQAGPLIPRQQFREVVRTVSHLLAMPRRAPRFVQEGRVLFCFTHRNPAHMDNLLPVAREALSRKILGGIVSGEDGWPELREFAGLVPMVSTRQLLGWLGAGERIRNVSLLRAAYRQITGALNQRIPALTPLIARQQSAILRELTDSLQFGAGLERLLSSWRPSCVVSTSDFWPLEHQLCRRAFEHHIPSVVIQHGVMAEFWWPFVADRYYLWGEPSVAQLRGFGAPEHRLTAVGMPATDKMFQRNHPTPRTRGVRDGRPTCLLISQTHGSSHEPEVFERYRRFVADVVALMPSIDWRIKLHPNEDDSFYRDIGNSIFERLAFYPKRTPLAEAIADADVATTVYSTGGLEAMMMDCPLIVGPLTPRVRSLAPWPAEGGGSYVSSAKDFRTEFCRLVSDQDCRSCHLNRQRRFLAHHFANRGCAAKRIVDLLEDNARQQLEGHTQHNQGAAK